MSRVEEIRSLTSSIWETMLGLPLEEARETALDSGPTLMGSVRITGAWNGKLDVRCTPSLARRAAAAMFACDQDGLSEEEVRDALGEIANMAGGNIKALLPQPNALSIPVVVDLDAATPAPSSGVCLVQFACDADPLSVQLVDQTNQEAKVTP